MIMSDVPIKNDVPPIKIFFNKIKNFWLKIWQKKLFTFLLLLVIGLIIFLTITIITVSRGGFLTIYSDDLLQYYPYINNLFTKIKEGNLSLYDTTLYGGTSFFAGIYYIPLDIFTFIAFLLSYLMQAETAYAAMNLLKPITGAFLMYYFLARKFSTKTAFIASIIYMLGGITQTYYIFPVYLGINFYVPLGLLLCDLVIEKKGIYYYLLTIYASLVIFYDYYMAYMMLACVSIYFVIELHIRNKFSFFRRNCFIINKEFWKYMMGYLLFILLGVLIASFILLPASFYVINETNRNDSSTLNQNNWYFTLNYSKDFSKRHYFTQWCNLFIPNEPHRFCLNEAGDYMREHASFYITTGGLIYLVYFFTLKYRAANRLKVWVLLFNILFLMPIFAKIFCFNEVPYSRWFFIPYIFNLYAACFGMNEQNFRCGKSVFSRILPLLMLTGGLITLLYVVIVDPKYFIHYNKADDYFYPILITSIIFLGCYIFLLILSSFISFFKKEQRAIRQLVPFFILGETVFSGIVIFSNVDNTYEHYYNNKNEMVHVKNNLVKLGYNNSDGYRINMCFNQAKSTTNANILVGNTNFGNFFQSFYNTPLTYCMKEVYNDNFTGWSRNFTQGYTLLSANLFNVKYVVVSDSYTPTNVNTQFSLPNYYYKHRIDNSPYSYYILEDCEPFIVYDTFTDLKVTWDDNFKAEGALLFTSYASHYTNLVATDENYEEKKKINDNYEKIINSGITFIDENHGYDKVKNYYSTSAFFSSNTKEDNYVVLDIKHYNFKDVLNIYVNNESTRRKSEDSIYIKDTNGVFHRSHYNTIYFDGTWTPDKLYIIPASKDADKYIGVELTSYSYDLYDDFKNEQKLYSEKYYKLDGSTMKIKCQIPQDSYDKVHIVKTAYTYSDDWKVTNNKYETCNIDGGFLGIIVPSGESDINITLNYEPQGYHKGTNLAIIATAIYVSLIAFFIYKVIDKKEKQKYETK